MPRREESGRERSGSISRRTLVGAIALGGTVAGSRSAMAQAERGVPPSVVTSPPRDLGYSGVTVWTPEGKLIGRIRLPESTANLSFGGPKRNRLFMAASQSLYAVYVGTQGAAPG